MQDGPITRVAIYAVSSDGVTGEALTTGFLVQRWLALALAPLDEKLSELGALIGRDDRLRVRTAVDDGTVDETIDATVFFSDPGEGMLAFLLLDRASTCRPDPLPPLGETHPAPDRVAASISSYALDRGAPAMRSRPPVPPTVGPAPGAERASAGGQLPDALLGPQWPRPHGPASDARPAGWPAALRWPPVFDGGGGNDILRQICSACPCFILCPPCRGAD